MAIPDADIYPEATGLAKHTVEKHKDPQNLVLYAGWFCPFVQRVWMTLEEKGVPYQYVEVNPYHKPESLLKLNPRGLVPTLQYDNKALYESMVVCEFLEDAYPEQGARLRPADPYQRALGRLWTDFVTTRIIPSYHRFLQHQPSSDGSGSGSGSGGKSLDDARAEFVATLKQWVDAMAASSADGPYFFGPEPSMPDLAMAPWASRLWVFDHFKGGAGVPEPGSGGADEETWARWRKYVAAIEQRKSLTETLSEREHYLPLYKRYADDVAQSEMAKASRAGRGVP